MHVTVNSQALAAVLRRIVKVVPQKPAIAILSHVLLRAEALGSSLSVYATDLELGLADRCQAHVEKPGVVALPAARLLALVEQFTDDDVSVEVEKSHVIVKCCAFKSRLQAMPADDFPLMPTIEGSGTTLHAAALQQALAKVRHAVMTSGSKYVLHGALLTITGQTLALVATDAKRLAMATIPHEAGVDVRFIIPTKTLDALAGLLDDEDVVLTVSSRHLFFSSSEQLLVSRMIDAEFPKYERIIPRDNNNIIGITRALFISALKRVSIVAEESCAVYLDIDRGAMKLSSMSAEIGSADEVVNVEYDGPPLRICINGDYVLDFLDAAGGQTVTMRLKDASSAALFTDGDDSIEVVMLMRT